MRDIEVHRDYGPIDLREIDSFEKAIGFRFPSAYRELLSVHNALSPKNPDFKFLDSASRKIVSRDITVFGFGEALPKYMRIGEAQDSDTCGHPNVVVFGTSANGDFICFDYRDDPATDEPKVVVMFHDYPDENRKLLVNFVAKSFDDFLALLYRSA